MRSIFFLHKAAGICVAVMLITACKPDAGVDDASKVLARVNDSTITEEQFNAAVESLLGRSGAQSLNHESQKKILEGMVASRAISQLAEKQIDVDLLLEIENKTSLHREKLLINEYMRMHVEFEPITDEQVNRYYQTHLDEFGGGIIREYEMIVALTRPTSELRQTIVEQLEQARLKADWRAYGANLIRQGYQVEHRKGKLNKSVLDSRMASLIEAVKVGESSAVTFINSKPVVVKVISEEMGQAKPLNEVSEEIRKKLTPLAIKKSVEAIQHGVLANSKVEYLDGMKPAMD